MGAKLSAHLAWLMHPRDLKHSLGLHLCSLPNGLIFTLFNSFTLPQILLEIDG